MNLVDGTMGSIYGTVSIVGGTMSSIYGTMSNAHEAGDPYKEP